MPDTPNTTENKEITATTALQVFFGITSLWELVEDQEIILLGNPDRQQFDAWKSNKTADELSEETLLRISHFMAIHKYLVTLLPSKTAAYQWVKKINNAPLFKGDTALNYMLIGDLSHIAEVRHYLESECL